MCSGEEGRSANLGFEDNQERMRSSQIVGAIAPIEQHLIVGFRHIQKRSRSRANCADAPSWTRLKTNMVLDEDRKIFEPECQNIDCPECLHGRVYSDREIGFYCMSCGHEFSTEEIVMLVEKTALTSRSMQDSGKSGRKPIAEIKELPPRKAKKVEHLSHEVTKPKKPDQSRKSSIPEKGCPILIAIFLHTFLGSMFLSLLCQEHVVPSEYGHFYNESGEAESRELTVCGLPTSMRQMLNAAQRMIERIPFYRFLFPAIFIGLNFFSFALFFGSPTRRIKTIKPTHSKHDQRQLSFPFDDSQN